MSYGPAILFSIKTVDKMSPATPTFVSATQVNNKIARISFRMPTKDADNSPLTGLSKLKIAYLSTTDVNNPFINKSMEQILTMRVRQIDAPLTVNDANTIKTIDIPIIALNTAMCFAVSCYDESDNCSNPYVFALRVRRK